jgi:hypothetical protein
MKRARGGHHGMRPLAVAVVMIAVVLLAAAPALAAPRATSLTPTAGAGVLTFGGGTTISATLWDTSADVAVGGQDLRVEQSTSGATGPWSLLYVITSPDGPYATGVYSGPVVPVQNTWYRFVFNGTLEFAPITSDTLTITVKPWLGKPTCPSSVKHGKSFTVKGSLKPRFPAGAKTVTVKAYRYKGNKWVFYKDYSAKNYDYKGYTQYKVNIKLSTKGTYRFKGTTKATAEWAAGASANSGKLKVK